MLNNNNKSIDEAAYELERFIQDTGKQAVDVAIEKKQFLAGYEVPPKQAKQNLQLQRSKPTSDQLFK